MFPTFCFPEDFRPFARRTFAGFDPSGVGAKFGLGISPTPGVRFESPSDARRRNSNRRFERIPAVLSDPSPEAADEFLDVVEAGEAGEGGFLVPHGGGRLEDGSVFDGGETLPQLALAEFVA